MDEKLLAAIPIAIVSLIVGLAILDSIIAVVTYPAFANDTIQLEYNVYNYTSQDMIVNDPYVYNSSSNSSSSWQYKIEINITNTVDKNLVDYPVKISLNMTPLYSSGKIISDLDDIRFADASDDYLYYWFDASEYDTTDNNTNSTLYVRMNLTALGTQTIYMHYDNPSAGSGKNFSNTFISGLDDFDRPDDDFLNTFGQTWAYNGDWNISNNTLKSNSNSSEAKVIQHNNITDLSSLYDSVEINVKGWTDSGQGQKFIKWYNGTTGALIWEQATYYANGSRSIKYYWSNSTNSAIEDDFSKIWHDSGWMNNYRAIVNLSAGIDYYVNNTLVASSPSCFNKNPCSDLRIFEMQPQASNPNPNTTFFYVNYIFIRENITSEPTIALGSEQASNLSSSTLISGETLSTALYTVDKSGGRIRCDSSATCDGNTYNVEYNYNDDKYLSGSITRTIATYLVPILMIGALALAGTYAYLRYIRVE